MFKNKKIIFPCGKGYICSIVLGSLFTIIGGFVYFIWTLCGQENNGKLLILQNDTMLNRTIEGSIILLIGILCFYFGIFKMYYSDRIIFEKSKIIKMKRKIDFRESMPAISIECNKIISAQLSSGFYAYLKFTTDERKIYKILVTPFSRKQILKICLIINERGGTIDIKEIERFLKEEYLFGKKKKRK